MRKEGRREGKKEDKEGRKEGRKVRMIRKENKEGR